MGGFMRLPRSLAALSAALPLASTMPQLAQAREIVGFSDPYSSGTVVVKTSERALYYVLGNGKAMRYPVGVGRAGKQWTGTARISGKYLKPAWSPPTSRIWSVVQFASGGRMYSRLHHMRIDRSRERPSSANRWPRGQCRWQISHCGGAPSTPALHSPLSCRRLRPL